MFKEKKYFDYKNLEQIKELNKQDVKNKIEKLFNDDGIDFISGSEEINYSNCKNSEKIKELQKQDVKIQKDIEEIQKDIEKPHKELWKYLYNKYPEINFKIQQIYKNKDIKELSYSNKKISNEAVKKHIAEKIIEIFFECSNKKESNKKENTNSYLLRRLYLCCIDIFNDIDETKDENEQKETIEKK
ncbi:hypothetical protein CWO85_00225 [Candidatus Phytoplasma ziziphi]|uniref:Uncharacterized protein n=1 Tax=Ziziphus jujuba witches'-broom phytoplasma TaxID=135727 RepID=A0A660HLN0_ZIZJU|nr:hypothetical protein [Candidatus Phytoplasma ziziphi]AYJ00973.1 hypothetical protein CWO85_00225 [Candidatus Phytoplasma ziziphi]